MICTGYLRQDGKKGIRNKILIIYTVDCSSHVAGELQRKYFQKGVDIDVVGQRSCHDHINRVQTLLSYCVHPNVGRVLCV